MTLEYQRPESRATLEEGLTEYYASREGLVLGRGASEAAREFFRCHDAAHVVFGCDTSLPDEATVKLWSVFGTTGGLHLLQAYRLPESQEIYETIRWPEVARTALRALGIAPRVLLRCMRMRERWPWAEFDAYRETELGELRKRFGIEILARRSVPNRERASGAARRR